MLNKTQLKEYHRRRQNLMRAMGNNAIAIIPAANVKPRNRDVDYPYRQDSDFFYLTGFTEPESVALLAPGRKGGEFILFCRQRDPQQETWHGRRLGVERAPETLGADDAFPIDDIDEILPGMMEHGERIFYSMGLNPEFDAQVMHWVNQVRANIRAGSHPPKEFISLDHILHEMRLYKSRLETGLMRKAGKISAQAHMRAMQACKPGMTEYQLAAEFTYTFAKNNACEAYPSIVGGGANGCILHYTENSDALQDGDLVLIDAGAEYQGYAADITRTFPVNGRFSSIQREVYEIVLEAQAKAIDKVKPGNSWDDPHQAAIRVLTKGLVHLGLLKGNVNQLIKKNAYQPYYMHRTGHWLGMDVHDVGDYKLEDDWRLLEKGMVTTVEPGLYFPAESGVPKHLANIGIRIEDDVVVTRDGNEVLTDLAPKSVEEIEALMASTP